jgi:TP901 family phage tail tape measure protein
MMADEIKQVMGFDAAQALDALNQLDSGFAKMQANLNSSVATFNVFNQGAGKTVSALVQIATRANQAADALNRLNTIKPPPSTPGGGLPALPGGNGSATQLLTGNSAAAALNSLLGQTTNQASAAAAAVANVGNQGAASLNAAGRAAGGFALSLETITRVIGTQIIVRTLNAIRSAVEDSFQGFIDFNRVLAEIQTIASGESLAQLGVEVRGLSDNFNAPLLDVAKGKYEALSNGFVKAGDSTKILTASLKFAKVGIATTAQSVDLISTSLNAYGKSAEEAETISAKLFKTIELGRVVGSELANAFGRVAPIGKEIGATEDELLAAFSSITIGGVKASEAATQIRATLTALLKPSEATAEALRKLGFETGEQLVQARGFKGALDALISTTDGSTSSIAKLFPNVRALNGVLRETGTGATIFEDHLKAIQQASSELLNQKFQIRIESDAERVSADINKLKNFFTTELGSQLVGTTSNLLKLVGGVETLTTGISAVAPTIAVAVGALLTYGTAAGTVTAINRTLTTSFSQAGLATRLFAGSLASVVALIAAISAGQFIGEQINRSIEEARKKAKDESSQLLTFQRDQAVAAATLDKLSADEKFKTLNNSLSIVRKAFFDQTDAAKIANQELLENDKATFDKIVASREKFAQDLKRAAQQADTDIIDSKKRVNDISAQLDDQRFNFQNKRFNELSQTTRERQRADSLAAQAATKLATASKPEEKEAAQSAFQRAESFARQAVASAQTTGNITAQVLAERTLEGILQKRIDAEAQFQKGREADAKRLEAAAAAEEARVTKLKSLAKDFLESASLFQLKGPNKGDLLSKEQIDKNLNTAREKLAAFKEEAFGKGAKFNLEDLFSFDKLEQRLHSSFTKGEVNQLFASDDALARLRAQVQQAFDKADILVSLAVDPSKLAGKTVKEQVDEVSKQLGEQQEKLDGLRTSSVAREDAERGINEAIRLGNQSLQERQGFLERDANQARFALFDNRSIGSAAEVEKQLALLRQLREETAKLSVNPNTSAQQVNDLRTRALAFEKTAPFSAGTDIERFKNEFNLLVKIFELRSQIKGLDTSGQTAAALQAANDQLSTATQRATASASAAAAEGQGATSTANAAASASQLKTSTDALVSPSRQFAENMERAQKAAASTTVPAVNPNLFGGPETQALGGLIQRFSQGGLAHFSGGGMAKGTDNIPALLSQDEMVINARSSRRFFAQLQSIQAGVQPAFNSSRSGDTFNIGDININESSDAKATAREVINLIRREQRRGTGNKLH